MQKTKALKDCEDQERILLERKYQILWKDYFGTRLWKRKHLKLSEQSFSPPLEILLTKPQSQCHGGLLRFPLFPDEIVYSFLTISGVRKDVNSGLFYLVTTTPLDKERFEVEPLEICSNIYVAHDPFAILTKTLQSEYKSTDPDYYCRRLLDRLQLPLYFSMQAMSPLLQIHAFEFEKLDPLDQIDEAQFNYDLYVLLTYLFGSKSEFNSIPPLRGWELFDEELKSLRDQLGVYLRRIAFPAKDNSSYYNTLLKSIAVDNANETVKTLRNSIVFFPSIQQTCTKLG